MPWGKRTALAALAAAVLAGCGSSDDKSIPPDASGQLIAQLHQVQDQVNAGNCEVAKSQATVFKNSVGSLPSSVDSSTKQDLTKLADNLVELASNPAQCASTGATGVSGATSTEGSSTSSTESNESTEPETTSSTTTSTTSTAPEESQPSPPTAGGEQGNGQAQGNEGNPGGHVIQGGGSSGSGGIKP
jgi:hypothetical protein